MQQPKGTELDMAAANKTLVETYHYALWRDGDKTAIDRYWSPEAQVHMTDFAGTAVDVIHEDVERYWGAFNEVETRIEHLVAEDDKVVLHWSTAGTHFGTYGEIAATGKRITMTGMDMLRIGDGKIIECWSMWDGLSVYEQLGVLNIG